VADVTLWVYGRSTAFGSIAQKDVCGFWWPTHLVRDHLGLAQRLGRHSQESSEPGTARGEMTHGNEVSEKASESFSRTWPGSLAGLRGRRKGKLDGLEQRY
jgi:hypothetical protein